MDFGKKILLFHLPNILKMKYFILIISVNLLLINSYSQSTPRIISFWGQNGYEMVPLENPRRALISASIWDTAFVVGMLNSKLEEQWNYVYALPEEYRGLRVLFIGQNSRAELFFLITKVEDTGVIEINKKTQRIIFKISSEGKLIKTFELPLEEDEIQYRFQQVIGDHLWQVAEELFPTPNGNTITLSKINLQTGATSSFQLTSKQFLFPFEGYSIDELGQKLTIIQSQFVLNNQTGSLIMEINISDFSNKGFFIPGLFDRLYFEKNIDNNGNNQFLALSRGGNKAEWAIWADYSILGLTNQVEMPCKLLNIEGGKTFSEITVAKNRNLVFSYGDQEFRGAFSVSKDGTQLWSTGYYLPNHGAFQNIGIWTESENLFQMRSYEGVGGFLWFFVDSDSGKTIGCNNINVPSCVIPTVKDTFLQISPLQFEIKVTEKSYNTSLNTKAIEIKPHQIFWYEYCSPPFHPDAGFLTADTLCENELLEVEALNDQEIVNKRWTIKDALTQQYSSNKTPLTFRFQKPGQYSLSHRLQWLGCDDQVVKTITVLPKPNADLGPDITVCNGNSAYIAPVQVNADRYAWSTGGTTAGIEATLPGLYSLIAYKGDCSASDTIQLSFLDANSRNFITYDDTILCKNQNLEVRLSAPGALEYVWSDGARGSLRTFAESGVWKATAMFRNCSVVDSFSLNILNCDQPFYIPNAFSPNADDINDVFWPYSYENQVEWKRLSIFNRMGHLLHEDKTSSPSWDGNFNGQLLMNGVYIYRLEYCLPGAPEIENLVGEVHLIR